MAYFKLWSISCDEDGCEEVFDSGAPTRTLAREWAMADGWGYDGMHWCP